tara:strand:+ start:10318 stop:11172 length:855 start_codon:yes stop_codon:yes gene_type:complete
MAGENWTEEENDRIVADYFAMLAHDLSGRLYVKSEHNRLLRDQIGRSRGSIEYKHQNISAALQAMGEAWIAGYKPAFNFQASLENAVARWLVRHPDWLARRPAWRTGDWGELAVREEAVAPALRFDPAPEASNRPPPDEQEQIAAIVRKFDVAARDERNRQLGKAGEDCVLQHERTILRDAGRDDLARKARWVSHEDGDGAGYDIASFDDRGAPRLIEVKTTNGWARTPFHISSNELRVAEAHRTEWRLVRLWDFSRPPRAFELCPPLDAHVSLTPTSFRASFQ